MQHHLERILPAVLTGLADESEGVRGAALAAGRTMVEMYADTALPLLLPAVEEGIVNDAWRIRQSSAELMGDLLFKVLSWVAVLGGHWIGKGGPHLMVKMYLDTVMPLQCSCWWCW